MGKFLRLAKFGFGSWLLTFVASVCLFPFRESSRPLFETLVGVCLAISTVLFTVLYFRKVKADYLREGALLGVAFLACNIVFDLFLFMEGPMKMSLADYMQDIGLAYLAMPVVSIGTAVAIRDSYHGATEPESASD